MVVLIPFISFGQKTKAISKSQFSIGETVTLSSEVLGEERTINIYLPTYYELDTSKKYPVIYLLDGSKDEDFIHVAGLVQFASFPWIKMMPESIVVGVANVDRKRDFTYPTTIEKDNIDFPSTGHSSKFIDFIENELQGFILDNYRCANQKTIIGQSLGGLLATEILFKKPDLFDNYIIVSPSLWWDNGSLFKQLPSKVGVGKSIFIGVGKEGEIMERDAMNLYVQLLANKDKEAKIFFKFLEDQDHGDALHLALYEAFDRIFKVEN